MRQPMTLAQANATLHGDDLYSYLYRRAQVVDRLSRDEALPKGWDKEFPDLAADRLRAVREASNVSSGDSERNNDY